MFIRVCAGCRGEKSRSVKTLEYISLAILYYIIMEELYFIVLSIR